MKVESTIFNIPAVFFFVVAVLYSIFASFDEWVGTMCLLLTGGLFLMVGVYFRMLDKRHGERPEDRGDGEISDQSGEQGVFAPWSWWPLVIAAAAALGFLALAIGWWIMVPAVTLTVIGLVGWVHEFSRGQHAH